MIATEHANGAANAPASDHRQVQPGLHLRHIVPLVGHVPHGDPADALEQSEAGSRQNMPTAW
ncbi:hypothetical protein RBWH47_05031 [Rhodopirellula baltica WH47]|uniref:Uncharacterized protein n=1 Tax=Rhodopirellula baltica WH47 TaxID=991778 RepID=F2AYJ6_RHOBT|nr:hypothetical protein RBWH47_05031 [Rhodopirellula baltica WH47]